MIVQCLTNSAKHAFAFPKKSKIQQVSKLNIRFHFDPSRSTPDKERELTQIFTFTLLCGLSEGF